MNNSPAEKLAGKMAFVTGAGRGIGRGCAVALARAGADLALNDLEENDDLLATAAEIESLGRRAMIFAGDAFDRTAGERLVARAIEALGRIDVFVNVPAFSRRAAFLECPPDVLDRTLQGTLAAGFFMGQFVARHMVARGGRGKIIFISSVQAEMVHAHCAAYSAAKAGLNQMAFVAAAELAPHRINVNVIEPGWIDTPAERKAFGDACLDEQAAQLPWGRLGTADDIGHAAAFLASDEADYITGTTLRVDGGYWLRHA
ncbi:MAG: SDR family NAD(P)-dependent oxidoreductase [Planctomycetia bacterium]